MGRESAVGTQRLPYGAVEDPRAEVMGVEKASITGWEDECFITEQFGTACCELVAQTASELNRALPAGLGFPGLAAIGRTPADPRVPAAQVDVDPSQRQCLADSRARIAGTVNDAVALAILP